MRSAIRTEGRRGHSRRAVIHIVLPIVLVTSQPRHAGAVTAKQTVMQKDHDLDGSEATQSIEFSFCGKSYTIDLNDSNAADSDDAVAPYIALWQYACRDTVSTVDPHEQRWRRPREGKNSLCQ